MEREAYLIEQIESYIDQLDLLGMQATIDQERIDGVVTRVEALATEYEQLLAEKAEAKIQQIEGVVSKTLEEEREKRANILAVITEKLQTFSSLFSNVKNIKVAAKLQEHIDSIILASEAQVHDYESDVKLVEKQLEEIKKAEALESNLQATKSQTQLEITNLRNSQISYTVLNENILKSYMDVLSEGNISQIDFERLQEKEKVFKKRQGQLLENLELARSAKDAEKYVIAYEERVKKNKLELDEIAEKKFLHLLKKLGTTSVDSYQALEARTKTIQAMVESRISQVEQLYQEGVTTKEEYHTLASQIDHSGIYGQLYNLTEIEKNEKLIGSIDEQLTHTRDHIKGKEELETIFEERAKGRGRTPVIPKASTGQSVLGSDDEPEIIFEDEEGFDGYEHLTSKQVKKDKKRHQIVSIEPAKASLLEKLGKAKNFLLSALESLKTLPGKAKAKVDKIISNLGEYKPTIGDKIALGETAQIYSDPMSVIERQDGKGAASANLYNVDLFVTKAAILDQTGTPVYITADYGTDLEMVAKTMNLVSGTYTIALGCSIGDANGEFIAASIDKVNPDIEKGWISAKESDLTIIKKLSEEMKKGGMVK